MGGAAKTIGRVGSGIFTLGGSEIARNNLGRENPISQVLQAPGTVLTGGAAGKDNMPGVFGGGSTPNPYVSGPFSLDPNQMRADQSAITGLGQKQYDQTIQQLPQTVTNAINQSLPGLEEKLNSQHLLNGTALPQELARQSSYFTQNLATPALQALQGTQTAGLQRGLSMEDFINQANVAKTIGAQMAPQPPSSKAQTGTMLQGVGALAPLAKAAIK